MTICHRAHSKKHPFVTIRVSRNAVPAHLRHGDVLGACTAAKIKKMKAADKARAKGKSKGKSNGKSGSHGSGHGKKP